MAGRNLYSRKFLSAFKSLMCFESGYCNHPLDLGGETKFGISKRYYPNLDIKNIALDDAKRIYHNDFWNRYGYDQIRNIKIASKVFSITVNTGPKQSHVILQRALNAAGFIIEDDGIFGPKTIEATNRANLKVLIATLKSENAAFYRLLIKNNPSQSKFIHGWMKRAYN